MLSSTPTPLFIGITIVLILITTALGIYAVKKAKKEI